MFVEIYFLQKNFLLQKNSKFDAFQTIPLGYRTDSFGLVNFRTIKFLSLKKITKNHKKLSQDCNKWNCDPPSGMVSKRQDFDGTFFSTKMFTKKFAKNKQFQLQNKHAMDNINQQIQSMIKNKTNQAIN